MSQSIGHSWPQDRAMGSQVGCACSSGEGVSDRSAADARALLEEVRSKQVTIDQLQAQLACAQLSQAKKDAEQQQAIYTCASVTEPALPMETFVSDSGDDSRAALRSSTLAPDSVAAATQASAVTKIQSITIDRSASADKSLGITVDPMDDKQLIIRNVKPVGLVEDYNSKQSDASLCLKTGDRIVEVNGIRGDARSMLMKCQELQILDFTVERDFLLEYNLPREFGG